MNEIPDKAALLAKAVAEITENIASDIRMYEALSEARKQKEKRLKRAKIMFWVILVVSIAALSVLGLCINY